MFSEILADLQRRHPEKPPENKSQTCLTFLKCQNVSKDFLWRRVESPFYPNDKERNVAHDTVKGHVGVDGAAVRM